MLPALFVLSLVLIGLIYVLNYKFVKTSSNNIEFAPAELSKTLAVQDSIVKPKNIIIFIADGMGFSHLSLAMLSQQAEGTPSVWQDFEVKGWHDARSTYGPLTDSGASATAMATGTSTFFEMIGMDDKENELENVFELASQNNYATAIVTDSYIWDATPAAFIAHTKSRDNAEEILKQIASSDLDLIFGELEDLGEGDIPNYEATIDILNKRFHLLDKSLARPAKDTNTKPLAAIYAEDEIQDMDSSPNLTELTNVALDYLATKDLPILMLVECEEVDSSSHDNDSERLLKGLKSIQSTLSLIQDFAETDGETLVIFTSDHETGGLAVAADSKGYPNMGLIWSSKDHTASVVPLLARGPGAERFSEVHRNWEIGKLLKSLISSE